MNGTTTLRLASLLLVVGGAWLIFAVGLIAPLTPSEGMPHPIEIAVFVGLPILLLAMVATKVRTRAGRTAAILQLGTILVIAVWVLTTQARL